MHRYSLQIFLVAIAFVAIAESQDYCREAMNILRNTSVNGKLQWTPRVASGRTIQRKYVGGALRLSDTLFRSAVDPAPAARKAPNKAGDISKGLPEQYDASQNYAECPSIRRVVDQQNCNNCWVIAATSMINDRLCMYKPDGQPQKLYSVNELTCQHGCEPGFEIDAVNKWIDTGLLPEECQPFPDRNRFEEIIQGTTACSATCDNRNFQLTPDQISYGGDSGVLMGATEEEIMKEIYLYGPVAAFMEVHDDFHCYDQGIYKHVAGSNETFLHALKLYGWGVEDGIKYWLGANSWGPFWGVQGLFRIQRGVNECQIEGEITLAVPKESLP